MSDVHITIKIMNRRLELQFDYIYILHVFL